MGLYENITNSLKEAEEPVEEKDLATKQKEEALKRMEMLRMSRQCINAFKRGEVWESEGIGSLYECNEKENGYIKEFENKYGGMVYHMIHNMFEFGECYSMLYVSKQEDEWEMDDQDLEDGYAFVYVLNVDDENSSEFGSIGIQPSIGGLRRTS